MRGNIERFLTVVVRHNLKTVNPVDHVLFVLWTT